jgi:predicted ester cyclase
VRYHGPRGPAKGYDDYRRMAQGFFAGIPDLHFDIEEAVERDGLVALRIRISGTHGGHWRGVAPTGRRIDVQGRPWLRVRDGKVAEVWSLFDELGAMQQVGAVPETLGRH